MKKVIFEKLKEAFERGDNHDMVRLVEDLMACVRAEIMLCVIDQTYNGVSKSETDQEQALPKDDGSRAV